MSLKSGESQNLLEFLSDSEGQQQDATLERSMSGKEGGGAETAPLVTQPTSPLRKSTCKALVNWLRVNLLLLLTVVSVIIGFIIGLSVREVNLEPNHYRIMVTLLSFPGEIFLRMLKMLILPLIVFSLVAGLGSLEAKVAGSLGVKTIIYYFTTTLLAVVLGLLLVNVIKPGGSGVTVECDNSSRHGMPNRLGALDSVLDLIRNMIPDNLFAATFQQTETQYSAVENVTDFKQCFELYKEEMNYSFAYEFTDHNESSPGNCSQIKKLVQELNLTCENATTYDLSYVSIGTREGMNVLGIIVFTIAFAMVLGGLGPEGKKIVRTIGLLNDVIMKLVTYVMWYSPIGIASIVAGKLAEVVSFASLIQDIGLYTVTVLVGLFIHGCIILPLIYTILTRKNPLRVVQAVLQALLTAFTTSSSSATLPITIQNLEQNFNADSRVTRFMLPIGATINMDGTALYEAVAAVFISQVQGRLLSVPQMIIVSITATCASIGAAGIPQAGLVTLVIVLVAVGLDPEDVAFILAVDWLLDRFRTTVNVLGDSFGVGIVQHLSRKQLKISNQSSPQGTSSEPNSDELPVPNESSSSTLQYGLSSPPVTFSASLTPQWSVTSSTKSVPPEVCGDSIEIPESPQERTTGFRFDSQDSTTGIDRDETETDV